MAGPFALPTFPQPPQVIRVVTAVPPARGAQSLQVNVRGQRHSLLLPVAFDTVGKPCSQRDGRRGGSIEATSLTKLPVLKRDKIMQFITAGMHLRRSC